MIKVRTLSGIQISLRAAVAGAFAVAIAKVLSFDYPIFAFISAVLVTDLSSAESRRLGLNRILATVIGALWGAILTPMIPSGPVAIGFGVFVAMATCHLLIGVGGARVAAFVCGIIVLDNNPEPWMYALHRLEETLLGVAVAWAISYVPKLFHFNGETERSSSASGDLKAKD